MIWARGIAVSGNIVTFLAALQYISLSDTVTVFQLRPFPTAFVCWLLLKERVTIIQGFAAGE